MRTFSLFEMSLTIFVYYAIMNYERGERILILIISLFTVFLFERLRGGLKKDWNTRKVFFSTNYHSIELMKIGSN